MEAVAHLLELTVLAVAEAGVPHRLGDLRGGGREERGLGGVAVVGGRPLAVLRGGGREGEVVVREGRGRGGNRQAGLEASCLLIVVVVGGGIQQHLDRT